MHDRVKYTSSSLFCSFVFLFFHVILFVTENCEEMHEFRAHIDIIFSELT